MAPFLVILGLLLLGVAIVAWHTRHTWWHLMPVRQAGTAPVKPVPPVAAGFPAEPAAFAWPPVSHPAVSRPPVSAPTVPPAAATESDPFAHAPDVSQLDSLQSGDTRL